MSRVSLIGWISEVKGLAGQTRQIHLAKASGGVYGIRDEHAGSQYNISTSNMIKQIIVCYPST